MSRGKRWLFTLNNYSLEEYEGFKSRLSELCSYCIIGRETGDAEGTPHLQGYCEFKRRYRFLQLKDSILPRSHIELARGTGHDNREYCSKSGSFWEHGDQPRNARGNHGDGNRSVRDELAVQIRELVERDGAAGARSFADSHPGVWGFSGHTLLRNTLALVSPVQRPEINVRWFWGDPGKGKSREAHRLLPQAYLKDGRTKWWNGYILEKEVIIDDFAPRGIDIGHLLVWFDRYKCRVETKGGYVALMAHTFIVTSNYPPQKCYCGEGGEDHPQINALLRRLCITEY